MGHRRVLNEGEGPAHPYLTLPEITAVLYAKEGSPQTGGTLHYTSKKVHEVYRRHADEFLFDSGSGHQLGKQSTWTRVQFPPATVAAHVFFTTTCQTTVKHQPSSAMVRPGAGLLSGGLQGSDLRQNHPDAPSTRGDDFRRWSNWVALTLWLPCVAPVAWV